MALRVYTAVSLSMAVVGTVATSAARAQVRIPLAPTATTALPVDGTSAQGDGAAPVDIEAKLSTTTPTFGDRIELRVTMRHRAGVRVFFPSKPDLRPLLVDSRDVGHTERTETNGQIVETVVVAALAVRSGALKLPAIEVPWTETETPGGQPKSGTVTIAPLRLTVRSQFAADITVEPAPLSPPRPLVEENVPLEIGLLIAVMMSISALATALALKFYRHRAGRQAPKPAPAPHTVAMRRLEELDHSERIATGDPAEVFAELSEILRQYLGTRFHFLALDMTSTELLHHLRSAPMRGVQIEEITAFTDFSDLVKFAHLPASAEELRSESSFVRKVVERTMITAQEQEQLLKAENERLLRIKRLRLQVIAPNALRLRALAIDVFSAALATALLAWVAIDTANRALFDFSLLILPIWMVIRDMLGPQSPGKAIVGLQIAENQDDTTRALPEWLPNAPGPEDLGATARIAGPWQRLVRNLSLAVPLAGLIVEAVTCLNLPEARRLGDQWADTRVIDAQVATRRGSPSWAPAVILLAISVVLLLMPLAMGGRPT